MISLGVYFHFSCLTQSVHNFTSQVPKAFVSIESIDI